MTASHKKHLLNTEVVSLHKLINVREHFEYGSHLFELNISVKTAYQ